MIKILEIVRGKEMGGEDLQRGKKEQRGDRKSFFCDQAKS